VKKIGTEKEKEILESRQNNKYTRMKRHNMKNMKKHNGKLKKINTGRVEIDTMRKEQTKERHYERERQK
jgi:hypothetical protein